MTAAKINNQYDYITLRIKFDKGGTLNFTRSRYGAKASGTLATKEALAFLDRWVNEQKGRSLGDIFADLQGKAATSSDMLSFLQAI